MFERFTTGARQAVVAAQEVARDLGDPQISPAHLLVAVASSSDPAAHALAAHGADRQALLDRFDGDGLDASALAALGIDLEAVRRRADAVFGAGALERAGRRRPAPSGHVPFTRDAKKTLETALRDMAKDRAEAMKKFRESRAERKQRPGAIERLEMRADFMEKRAAEMKKLAEAAKPLYDSLDEAQKGRFDVLMRAGMGPGHGPRVRHAGFHHRGAPPAPPAQQQQ